MNIELLLLRYRLTLSSHYTPNCCKAVDHRGKAVVVKCIDSSTTQEVEPAYIKDEFEREVGYAKLAAKHGIGPKVVLTAWHDNCGLLIQEHWDTTLEQFISDDLHLIEKNRTFLERRLGRIVRTLRRLEWVHADLVPRNVVCRVAGDQLRNVALIDFGLSFYKHEVGSAWPDFRVIVPYIYDPRQWRKFAPEAPSDQELARYPFQLDHLLISYVKSLSK